MWRLNFQGVTKIYAPPLSSILSHLQTPLPAVKTTSWALRSQTLFGWHLSCGCSTWLSEQNLLGKIWVKSSFFFGGGWILEGDFFWRNICLGHIIFFGGAFEGDFLEAHGCISGSLDFWKAWWSDSFTEGCPSPAYQSSPQKLCHVLYPFLGKLQYLTNLQFPERREINHQTNFRQNKKQHYKHHPQFVPPKQIHLQIST